MFTIFLSSAVFVAVAVIISSALSSAKKGHGLVRYFARLGIDLDYTAMVVALGMIPVFWLVAYVIRSWTMKWK